MARAAGGTVHVGKAAGIIAVALILGIVVLRSDGASSSSSSSAAAAAEAAARAAALSALNITTTTAAPAKTKGQTTTTLALRAPSTIKVVAVNATTTAGQAGKATTKLTAGGYNALQAGNATAAVRASKPAAVIYVVTPGYEREAAVVAALFGLGAGSVKPLPTPSPSTDIKPGVNIAVLVGSGIVF